MKYLITGVSGFVARHFINILTTEEPSAKILGMDMTPPKYSYAHEFLAIDLLDFEALKNALQQYRPDRILHLASFSSVARSWIMPRESFANNTNIFLNIIEIVRTCALPTRILSVGSSEEYGLVDPERLPLTEQSPLNPVSPYAVARVAQEQLSRIFANSFGLDIVMTRSFNHVGVGQEPIFVVPSFIQQFANHGDDKALVVQVGDTSIIRDFLDVRDVVKAYLLLLRDGRAGEVYNICSGSGHSIADIIAMIARISGKRFELHVDHGRIRPNDNKIIVGDYSKIRTELGWEPIISLEQSLSDIYRNFTEKQ